MQRWVLWKPDWQSYPAEVSRVNVLFHNDSNEVFVYACIATVLAKFLFCGAIFMVAFCTQAVVVLMEQTSCVFAAALSGS